MANRAVERLKSLFDKDSLSIIDKIWYKRITPEGYIVDKNDRYQAYFKVRTADLYSMDDNDLERYILQFTNLLRIYTEPLKIYSMTYPTETKKQQNYYAKLIKRYTREMEYYKETKPNQRRYEEIANKHDRALEQFRTQSWVEDNLKDLIFFIAIYGESKEALEENLRSMKRLNSTTFNIEHISDQTTLINLMKKMHNMTNEL